MHPGLELQASNGSAQGLSLAHWKHWKQPPSSSQSTGAPPVLAEEDEEELEELDEELVVLPPLATVLLELPAPAPPTPLPLPASSSSTDTLPPHAEGPAAANDSSTAAPSGPATPRQGCLLTARR
jgi:hypothetical protein